MTLRALAAAAALALGSSFAVAGITAVPVASDFSQHHLGQFDGTALYDSATGQLTLTIENTTSASNGGFLTGLAFDAGGVAAVYQDPDGGRKPNTNGFDELRNRRGIVHAGPFGVYHAGAGVNGKWAGAGAATRGIAAGASESFVFDVTSANASTLTVANFFTPGKNGLEIVASFKKLSHHRIDRVGGIMSGAVTSENNPPNLVTNSTGNGSNLPQPVGDPGLVVPGNGSNGNGGTTTAVPLPSAVWMALSTAGLAGVLKRKLRGVFA